MSEQLTAPPTEAPAVAPASPPASAPASPTAPNFWEQARQAITPASTWDDLPAPVERKPIIDTTGRAHAPETGQFIAKSSAAPAPTPVAPSVPSEPVAEPQGTEPAPAADLAPAGEPEAVAAEPAPAADDAKAETVVLTDRNGREVEVQVSDPDVAETLRMHKNNGLRRDQYEKLAGEQRAREREVQQFVATWETTPEIVFDQLRPDLQQRLARYVLATRFDTDFDTIKQFAEDPTARRETLVDLKDAIAKGKSERDQRLTAVQHAERVSDAVRAQIPATADETKAAAFLTAAAAYITGLVTQGTAVTPEQVPQLLAPLRSAYGLTEAPPSVAPTALSPAPTPADADLAARKAKAVATVQRLQRVADQRAVAAAVAPQGAGVAPVTAPMPPKGASLDDVTDFLKQRIRPGMSWTDYNQLK